MDLYRPVSRDQITASLSHFRDLFRRLPPANELEALAQERRELLVRNLLSNLPRTREHPTLHTVLEIANAFSLTLDGAHQLFGYHLANLHKFDTLLNGGRTRIIEHYAFERDFPVDLPSRFAPEDRFVSDALLEDLVEDWRVNVPIRALEGGSWQRADTFYIQVGTEDSLGSGLPPGSLALVEPVSTEEKIRPNPRSIYFLQFGNGYRCSRCVVSRGRLLLLMGEREYKGPQEFPFPEAVRIAGKVRLFALELPMPDYGERQLLPDSRRLAPLILPWEQPSMESLLASEHRRYRRRKEDRNRMRMVLEAAFMSEMSERTERRYRFGSSSQPHVHTLMQLALSSVTRYSDALLLQRAFPSDRGRFSLETLLSSRSLEEARMQQPVVVPPRPEVRWQAEKRPYGEWPSLLSLRFPRLRTMNRQAVRLAQGLSLPGLEPAVAPGSFVSLAPLTELPDTSREETRRGWARPLYAFWRGATFICGHLKRDGSDTALITRQQTFRLDEGELRLLHRVSGIAVPI